MERNLEKTLEGKKFGKDFERKEIGILV